MIPVRHPKGPNPNPNFIPNPILILTLMTLHYINLHLLTYLLTLVS